MSDQKPTQYKITGYAWWVYRPTRIWYRPSTWRRQVIKEYWEHIVSEPSCTPEDLARWGFCGDLDTIVISPWTGE